MKTLREVDFFKSSDIALCSAICCYGYQIEAIDKQNPNNAIFLIKKDEKLDNLIQLYFTHQLKVSPIEFFNFLKELKNRIYNA